MIFPFRIVEDFRDWTNWLLYRGGIGVKGEESWEAWWEEELVLFLVDDACLFFNRNMKNIFVCYLQFWPFNCFTC